MVGKGFYCAFALLFCSKLLLSQVSLHQGDSKPLYDPMRPVTMITKTSFTLQYFTATPCETKVQVREGDTPMVAWRPSDKKVDFWSQKGVRVVNGDSVKRTYHVITVNRLRPGKRYFYRIYDPGSQPTRQEKEWGAQPPWRREYAVSTLAPKGMKTIIHLPVKVLLMPNVINVASAHDEKGVIAPMPSKLTDQQIVQIKSEYETVSRFFWVNSGMRLWVNFHIFIDDRWQRWGPEPKNVGGFYKGWVQCRSYAGQDFIGPGGGDFTILDTEDITRVTKEAVYEERPYSGQIEQAFPRRWNSKTKNWEFYNSGGGTYGVDNFPQGFPGRSQFLGGGDTAWLVCHEFHHNLESHSSFSLSNREDERIIFNHPEPRKREIRPDNTVYENSWNTAGRHGEHWNVMAYWDRTITDAQWLRFYFGETITVKDNDEDGFPDDDLRLPLDEKRFGSDSHKKATDGRLNDLQKAMLSTWAPSCLQFTFNKPPFQSYKPDPKNPDSDHDGITDDIDPYPLYPWQPFIWAMRATVDGKPEEWDSILPSGELSEGGLSLTFKQTHDETAYYGLFLLKGQWKRLYAVFDGEGKGVFSGVGVQGFEVINDQEIEVRPVWGKALGLKWEASIQSDGTTVFEFSFPNRGEGIWYWLRGGREVGVSIDLFSVDGKGYSLYEPYHLFYFLMLEPNGRYPLPKNFPPELSRENATKIFFPGDPILKIIGKGWRIENGAWRHSGHEESIIYLDGLNVIEFDLWMEFEAKQDGILGAFSSATKEMNAGKDYIAFVGGYANTATRFRLFGREEDDSEVMMSQGKHTMQLSRRESQLWVLFDGKLILWASDPEPKKTIDRLAVIGGYNGDQIVHEIRIRF